MSRPEGEQEQSTSAGDNSTASPVFRSFNGSNTPNVPIRGSASKALRSDGDNSHGRIGLSNPASDDASSRDRFDSCRQRASAAVEPVSLPWPSTQPSSNVEDSKATRESQHLLPSGVEVNLSGAHPLHESPPELPHDGASFTSALPSGPTSSLNFLPLSIPYFLPLAHNSMPFSIAGPSMSSGWGTSREQIRSVAAAAGGNETASSFPTPYQSLFSAKTTGVSRGAGAAPCLLPSLGWGSATKPPAAANVEGSLDSAISRKEVANTRSGLAEVAESPPQSTGSVDFFRWLQTV